MNTAPTSPTGFSQNADEAQSSVLQQAPRMSSRTLTALLALMCLVPAITIITLWKIMPPVKEGQLEITITRVEVPDIDYYLQPIEDRSDVSESRITIVNESDNDWAHIVLRVNGHYNVNDEGPIPAGGERSYLLNRFISRTGARFDLRQLPLRHVRVFAKQLGKGNRASFDVDYPEMILKR